MTSLEDRLVIVPRLSNALAEGKINHVEFCQIMLVLLGQEEQNIHLLTDQQIIDLSQSLAEQGVE